MDAGEWQVASKKRGGKRGGQGLQGKAHHSHSCVGCDETAKDEPADPERAARTARLVRERAESLRGSKFLVAAEEAVLACLEATMASSSTLQSPESDRTGSMRPRLLCLGIGSPEVSASSVWQLALAWQLSEALGIADRAWSDPQMTRTDAASGNELGFQEVLTEVSANPSSLTGSQDKPLLLFMPHCDRALYERVVAANLQAADTSEESSPGLADVALLGNSFQTYAERDELGVVPRGTPGSAGCDSLLRRVAPLVQEQRLPDFQPCPEAFNDLSVISLSANALSGLRRG